MNIKATIIKSCMRIILVGVLAIAGYNGYQSLRAYKVKASALEQTISNLNQQIEYTEIKMSDSIRLYQAEVKALQMTKDNLLSRYNNLLKASRLKATDVSDVTEVVSTIADSDTVVSTANEFGGITANLSDPYVNINVEVFPNLNTIIEYEIRDSLTVISIQKRHSWLFGLIKWKEAKGVRVINHNPKAKIIGLNNIEVIE